MKDEITVDRSQAATVALHGQHSSDHLVESFAVIAEHEVGWTDEHAHEDARRTHANHNSARSVGRMLAIADQLETE